MPNTTKQTLKAHLETEGFNNLIWDNGNNILEVDLIKGVKEEQMKYLDIYTIFIQ